MYLGALLCMVLVKETFKMINIQDSEMMQLMHEKKSYNTPKVVSNQLKITFTIKLIFLLFFKTNDNDFDDL